jgi:hypothetical protein
MGSGFSGTLLQLKTETFQKARKQNLLRHHAGAVSMIKTNVVYAVAVKEQLL